MSNKKLFIAVLVLMTPVYAASINQLVVFGDSLSDVGNAAAADPGALPADIAFPRITDGLTTAPSTSGPLGLWIDQFAGLMKLTDPAPALLGGTNFAVASAQTGTSPNPALPYYVTDQVNAYLKEVSGAASPDALYTFWAGAEDIFNITNPATALTAATTAADNIYNNILTLAARGGKNFLWLNLPPLGEVPNVLAQGPALITVANAASAAFDTEWATDLAKLQAQGIQVTGVNIAALFTSIEMKPAAYGFSDITDRAWCGAGGLPNCAANNPNTFLFWDGEHPTTAGDALVAQAAFNALSPAAVPEPSTSAFGCAGLAVLLFKLRSVKKRGV